MKHMEGDDYMIEKNNLYKDLIKNIKLQIKNSQQKALFAVNKELTLLYWNIGNVIIECQDKEGWGAKVIDNISKDIKSTFPDLNGFSIRNLKYMRKFAQEYS